MCKRRNVAIWSYNRPYGNAHTYVYIRFRHGYLSIRCCTTCTSQYHLVHKLRQFAARHCCTCKCFLQIDNAIKVLAYFACTCCSEFANILVHSVVPKLSVIVHPALQDLHFAAPVAGHPANVDATPFAQVQIFPANDNASTELHSRIYLVIQTGAHETHQHTQLPHG